MAYGPKRQSELSVHKYALIFINDGNLCTKDGGKCVFIKCIMPKMKKIAKKT